MTILYDTIPGRFEDPVERQRLHDERCVASWNSGINRKKADADACLGVMGEQTCEGGARPRPKRFSMLPARVNRE